MKKLQDSLLPTSNSLPIPGSIIDQRPIHSRLPPQEPPLQSQPRCDETPHLMVVIVLSMSSVPVSGERLALEVEKENLKRGGGSVKDAEVLVFRRF